MILGEYSLLSQTISLKGVKDMVVERFKLIMDVTCKKHAKCTMENDEWNLLKRTV